MINLYINEKPCRKFKILCNFFRIKINIYDNEDTLKYPCILLEKNNIFCKNFISYIVKLLNKKNPPIILGYNRNFINEKLEKLEICTLKDFLFEKKLEINAILLNNQYKNFKFEDYFKFDNFKKFSFLEKSLFFPVKVDENENMCSFIPRIFKYYCSFNNPNKYQLTILENNINNSCLDWISYFKNEIFDYEFNLFIILNNKFSNLKLIKKLFKFNKIVLYKIDYDFYDLFKRKYTIIENFRNLINLIKQIGFNLKINVIYKDINEKKLDKILNLKPHYYKDEEILIFESYQINLLDFTNKMNFVEFNFLEEYIEKLNTSSKQLIINDSIIKKCYNLSLFNTVDKILELSFKHKFTAKEYYYSKKLAILFYTNSIGKLNKMELKEKDLDLIGDDNKPIMWLACKYFSIKQKILSRKISNNIDLIIKSFILFQKLELKVYSYFTNDDICDTLLKNCNKINKNFNEIITKIFLINSEYTQKNLKEIKKNIKKIDLSNIIYGKNNQFYFQKYGYLIFKFHSTIPQFINKMENIFIIRENSIKFYKDINNINNNKLDLITNKDIVDYGLFELINPTTNFTFSYHGENSKDLFINRNNILKVYLKNKYKSLNMEYSFKKRDIGKKHRLKIAFYSNFLTRRHSVFKDRHQIIKYLSEKSEFKVYVLTFNDFKEDVKDNFKNCEHIKLKNKFEDIIKTIRNLDLDFLIFCEIGMDPRAYYSAFYKLSRITLNTWGHSDTSGIDKIDYFMSSRYYENEESRNNYSEKLILLDSLCTCYVNPTEKYNLDKKTYNYSLFENQEIILCNQSLFKILPIFDEYIIEILKSNKNSLLVLIDSVRNLREKFMKRIFKKCNNPQILNRIKIIDHGYGHDEFVNLVKLSKIQLDVYPFGGCNSSLECLSLDIPVVTQPSKIINGRFTKGFYNKMDICELIVNNKKEYIILVNKLLQDKIYYKKIINNIKNNKYKLFLEKKSCITWENFLKKKNI